jgi:hypothetical protein
VLSELRPAWVRVRDKVVKFRVAYLCVRRLF